MNGNAINEDNDIKLGVRERRRQGIVELINFQKVLKSNEKNEEKTFFFIFISQKIFAFNLDEDRAPLSSSTMLSQTS